MDETCFQSELLPIPKIPQPTAKNPPNKKIFALFLYVVIFSNFDTGVIPAALNDIQKGLNLSKVEEAALGSLPFFGISFGALLVSFLMKKLTTLKTLLMALFLNILCSVWFAFSYSLTSMYFSRFLMGFTQAFWVVYGPVWTNHFSPKDSQTTWLGILQGFSPIGIILGYSITALIVNNWDSLWAWRMGVLFQAIGEFPILFVFIFLNNSDLSIKSTPKSVILEEIHEINNEDAKNDFSAVFSNFLYILAVCSNCVAFFVVFGLQFWGTIYMIDILEQDSGTAMATYVAITLTAPFFGVIFGGFLSDKFGGYKGKRALTALKLCLVFSLFATLIALAAGFVFTLVSWATLVWLQIFFGACLIPPGSGIVVNSVEKQHQTAASGFAQIIYNILGYFLSPLFSAFIMERFVNKEEGMIWGY